MPLLCVFRGAAASRGRGPFLPVPTLPVIRHIVGTLGQSPFTCLPANPVITEQTGAQEGRGPVQPLQPLQLAHFPVCSGAAQGTGPVWRGDGRAVRSGLTSQFSRRLMPITRTEATCSAANEEQQINPCGFSFLFFSFQYTCGCVPTPAFVPPGELLVKLQIAERRGGGLGGADAAAPHAGEPTCCLAARAREVAAPG